MKRGRFLLVYVFLVLLSFGVNHPGRLTSDTIGMVGQALRPELLDTWHGIFLPLLWSASNPLGQPAGALLIQCLLFFLLPAIIIARFLDHPLEAAKRPVFWLWVLFTCGLVGLSGEILKDVMGAAFLLCVMAGAALLAERRQVRSGPALLLIFSAAAFALVRTPNFLVLAFAACVALYWMNGLGKRFAIGAAAAFATAGAFAGTSDRLLSAALDVHDSFPERSLIIFDVAGISDRTGRNRFLELPPMREAATQRPVHFCYGPDRWDRFGFGWCRGYSKSMAEMMAREGKSPLLRWWIEKIAEEPVQYARHRINHSLMLLWSDWVIAKDPPQAFNGADNAPAMRKLVIDQGYGPHFAATVGLWRPRPVLEPFLAIERLFFGNRWMSGLALLICLALLAERLRNSARDHRDLPIILGCSLGLGNFLMLGVFSVADEARYMLPTVLCAASALALRLLKSKPAVVSPAGFEPATY